MTNLYNNESLNKILIIVRNKPKPNTSSSQRTIMEYRSKTKYFQLNHDFHQQDWFEFLIIIKTEKSDQVLFRDIY